MSAGMLPCTFVIFGATGNLATNKLLPALYHLEAAGRLPESLNIVAFSRRPWDDAAWHAYMRETLTERLGTRIKPDIFERFIHLRHAVVIAIGQNDLCLAIALARLLHLCV